MTDGETINRKELARKMAIARTKTVTRKTLSSEKSDFSSHRPIARKPNMICVTGEEANGW